MVFSKAFFQTCFLLFLVLSFSVFTTSLSGETSSKLRIARTIAKKAFLKKNKTEKAKEKETLFKETGIREIYTTKKTGDSLSRFDIVFIADCFTAKDKKLFDKTCDNFTKRLAKIDPFSNYFEYFNVHRIWTEVDSENKSLTGINRSSIGSICCNIQAARAYASYAPDADMIVVVSNIKEARATAWVGAGILTMGTTDGGKTLAHELAHAFASLGDEYVDAGAAAKFGRYTNREPGYPNVTKESNIKKAKWNYFNFNQKSPVVDCFEGAFYKPKGYYRPAQNCIMRNSHDAGVKFCPVCAEAMERIFYRTISVISDVNPKDSHLTWWLDDSKIFRCNVLQLKSSGKKLGKLKAFSYLNGEKKVCSLSKRSASRPVSAKVLGHGKHTFVFRLDFINNRIIKDFGLLEASRVWDIDVIPFKKPSVSVKKSFKTTVGEKLAFDVTIKGEYPKERFQLKLMNPTGDMALEDGKFSWTPSERGARVIDFALTDGKSSISASTLVKISNDNQKNQKPVIRFIPDIEIYENETLELPKSDDEVLKLFVDDLDKDSCVTTLKLKRDKKYQKEHPEGLVIDENDGTIKWTPDLEQSGVYLFTVSATDHKDTDSYSFTVTVKDRAAELTGVIINKLNKKGGREAIVSGDELAFCLRSSVPGLVNVGFRSLEHQPDVYRYLEYLRLMRSKFKPVRTKAVEEFKKLNERVDKEKKSKVRFLRFFVQVMYGNINRYLTVPEMIPILKERMDATGTVTGIRTGYTSTAFTSCKKELKKVEAFLKDSGE